MKIVKTKSTVKFTEEEKEMVNSFFNLLLDVRDEMRKKDYHYINGKDEDGYYCQTDIDTLIDDVAIFITMDSLEDY